MHGKQFAHVTNCKDTFFFLFNNFFSNSIFIAAVCVQQQPYHQLKAARDAIKVRARQFVNCAINTSKVHVSNTRMFYWMGCILPLRLAKKKNRP